MKRLSIGLGSVVLLSVIAAYAGNDSGETATTAAEADTAVNNETSRREATREAIRRAVRGDGLPQEKMEKRYQPVSHEEIDRYVGSWVKLETYFGRKVEGTLRSVNGNTLYIDEHLGQGSASYPIDKTKLSGLKVLR
ncbi:hypothetical protein [Amphritea pacifica]|uniref:Uncharacterized protein n=1 Tax=Amphritea pacifica TaxID=2811233 RepID=A0ABS2W3S8_9GAMM|nr:hypothetical protein [Amphritea pacifica]MBN0986371.1 hypothetical protein [Amphritea pacifica]MBN1007064.1 hypothetical protein [Amphritea pacifica]